MLDISRLRRRAQAQTADQSRLLHDARVQAELELAPGPVPTPNEVAAPEPKSLADLHPERKRITMIGVILAMLLAALDQTIVSTALPRITRELGGADHITWVFTAYMLASTVTVPIYGKLSDLFGRKWFFFSGIVIFLLGSVLAGMSQDMVQLIAFRALQGIGGGAIMGNAFAIIADLFAPAERARWQGALGGVFGLASVIGPALGGWLTDSASWRWVFYINIPLGLIALAFIAFLMPRIVPHATSRIIDYVGAVTLAITLIPLLLALSLGGSTYAWNSAPILAMFALSAAGLASFIVAEKRSKEPIIPLDLFKNPIFTVSVAITFLVGAAMFGAILFIPMFGQLVQGVSATNSGTMLTPLMVGIISASIISGQLVARLGKYRLLIIAAAAELTLSLLWLSTITAATGQLELMIKMVVLGLGIGVMMPIFNIVVQNAFDVSRTGVVTSSIQLSRSVGGTVGTALFGAFFNNVLADKAAGLSNTAFAQSAAQTGLKAAEPNTLQFLLSGEGQARVAGQIAGLPGAVQAGAAQAFATYLDGAKVAMATATGRVFLVASVTAAVAFVLALFIKEIPLRDHRAPQNPE